MIRKELLIALILGELSLVATMVVKILEFVALFSQNLDPVDFAFEITDIALLVSVCFVSLSILGVSFARVSNKPRKFLKEGFVIASFVCVLIVMIVVFINIFTNYNWYYIVLFGVEFLVCGLLLYSLIKNRDAVIESAKALVWVNDEKEEDCIKKKKENEPKFQNASANNNECSFKNASANNDKK